jgi:hypothetical protein
MAYGQNMNAPMSGLMGLAAMKGRMGDNTLVHVNPMELKTLNALAGPGGLTQNPVTGLPEAFKIKDILPVLGAIAAPYAIPFMMGGAAAGTALTGLAGAAAAGGGAALGAKLGGASTKEALTQGLTSAVTAGMFGGLKGAEKVGEKAAEETLKKGVETVSAPTLTSGLGQKALGQAAEENIAKTILDSSASGLTQKAALESAKTAVGQQVLKQTAGAGLGAIAGTPIPLPEQPTYTPPSTVPVTQTTQTASAADIDRFIRQGGPTPQFFNYSPAQIPVQFGGMAKEGGSMGDVPATYMAQGGDTGMFSGMVEAPEGDGMSDNVSFEVVGDPEIKQAMLSPDEYVMDAFTVAALGNGSSDAGAEKLDNFRLALREKVYGKEAQPKQVDGAKELSRLT